MSLKKATWRVGSTAYTIEDNGNGFAKLTRNNTGGEQVTFYPIELLVTFVEPAFQEALGKLLRNAMK